MITENSAPINFGLCAVLSLFLTVVSAGGVRAQADAKTTAPAQQSNAEKSFEAGNKLAEAQQYPQALVEYRKALAAFPDSPGLLWNAGTTAYFVKDYAFALALWRKLKTQEPEDDAVRAKLIQVFQAQGDAKSRAQERVQLVALRKSKKNKKLTGKASFCCDQFTAATRKVFAYDFLEMTGDRPLRYNFLVLKPDGTTDFRISVGSYKDTNEIAHELGELKPGERLFHLDGYYEQGRLHKTFRFYNSEPTYDAARKDVIAVLENKLTPMSSSTRPK